VTETKPTIMLSVICFIIMAGIASAQAIPEEARRHLARGEAAMAMAKSSDEYAPDAAQIRDRIYKIEYRVEQVLTVPEIMKVLTSLSNEQVWRRTGNCSTVPIEFRDANDKRDDHVSVLTGSFLSGGDIYKPLQIRGPVFDYSFFVNPCPAGKHQRDYDCFGVAQITVEIVSKKLVKVRQKSVRQDPNGFIPKGERSCVFQKQEKIEN